MVGTVKIKKGMRSISVLSFSNFTFPTISEPEQANANFAILKMLNITSQFAIM